MVPQSPSNVLLTTPLRLKHGWKRILMLFRQLANKTIAKKCEAQNEYIQLIVQFAPAIKCVTYWNKSRELKVTELLTVSDEAFLSLCLSVMDATG
jgi:hypothetical protein